MRQNSLVHAAGTMQAEHDTLRRPIIARTDAGADFTRYLIQDAADLRFQLR